MRRSQKNPHNSLPFVGLYDLHAPYHDPEALSTALAFVRSVRPAGVVVGGDWADFYQCSKFVSDPGRQLELQPDLDTCYAALRELRRAAPNAKIVYLRGNHEHRLQKYLFSKAPELSKLRALTVPDLLRLKELDIEWIECGFRRIGGLFWKHGNIVRNRAGYSAYAELEKTGVSGVSGHTHRLAQVYRTTEAGRFTWVEAGCLCGMSPEYAEGQTMDWLHGIVYAELEQGGDAFSVHPVPIVNGRIRFGLKTIEG